jgi:hypothetical protein
VRKGKNTARVISARRPRFPLIFAQGWGVRLSKKSGVESIHLFLLFDTIVDDGFEQVRFIAPRLA